MLTSVVRAVRCIATFICTAALVAEGLLAAERLSPLAPTPDWLKLDVFQETITAKEFATALRTYAPEHSFDKWAEISSTMVRFRGQVDAVVPVWTLRFAKEPRSTTNVGRYWRTPSAIKVEEALPQLSGVNIAIDPGHIGGTWAKLEERWFQKDGHDPVIEGDLTLRVAQILAAKLTNLGAKVTFLRDAAEPITNVRPGELREVARESLRERGVVDIRNSYDGPIDLHRQRSIQWEAERLFYRVAEIRARADLVNERIKPDVTICLHFNAEEWGDPADPTLVAGNHMHLLINGAYESSELEFEDVRFEMLQKLLQRTLPEELSLAEHVAAKLAASSKLPPYEYQGTNTRRAGKSRYVWSRNLLANRLYQCPVVYAEPYVMNNAKVIARLEMGDYDGSREIDGVLRKSIYREYADGVADGVLAHFVAARASATSATPTASPHR